MPKVVNNTVWQGPDSSGPQGGITQSLVGRFLSDRERFRLLTVLGLKASEGWSHKLGFGSMFHVCEEHAAGDWQSALTAHCQKEADAHPFDRHTIEHWWAVCLQQFPTYQQWWSQHPQTREGTPMFREQEFRVPYKLRWSGRVVYLRGKWDGADLCQDGIWQLEHKTKGDLDAHKIARQLRLDLQTMFYRVAMDSDPWGGFESEGHYASDQPPHKVKGVLYNCIRRPLSGGKGTIRQLQPTKSNPLGESRDAFYQRVGKYIRDDPGHFFMRFESEVSEADVERFRLLCLDPILDQVCDWWSAVNGGDVWRDSKYYQNFLTPFGVYSPMSEGRATDLDTYLESGSESGLTRVTDLFPELGGGKDAEAAVGTHQLAVADSQFAVVQ